MPDASHERAQRLTGIALMCGAVACFAVLDTTAKYLNLYMATLQVVWARYTGAFLYPFIVSNPWTRPGLMRTGRPVLQIVRSFLLLGSTLCNFAGAALPAARRGDRDHLLDAVLRRGAVGTDPGRVGALAALDRDLRRLHRRAGGDPPGHRRIPSGGAALAHGGACSTRVYSITTRILARTDSNETTLFYSNVIGAIALMPVVPFVWTPPTDPLVIALMVASGAMGSFGHYLLIAGHRLAPAAVLSPFIYTELVLVIALGYLVFGDVPNRWTLIGSAIVVGSGLYLIHRERKVRGQK